MQIKIAPAKIQKNIDICKFLGKNFAIGEIFVDFAEICSYYECENEVCFRKTEWPEIELFNGF